MDRTALDLPAMSKTLDKPREGLFASSVTLYICVVMVAALASYAYWVRARSLFACQADGYSADSYIAYCNGANYADYEHGAFWFGLEPAALEHASKADVLFLGDSRLQEAFSTQATTDWFSAAARSYYLMGFSYGENAVFAEALLRKLKPRAPVLVINLEGFFIPSETPPAKTVLHDPQARSRYDGKRFWQSIHERVCKAIPRLCGSKAVTYRSRETGAYVMQGQPVAIAPVSFDNSVNQEVVDHDTATAIDFLKRFTQGKCVILTLVPKAGTKIGNANAIAAALGTKLVAPEVPEGLQTVDGQHLDRPSAQRWSEAFFRAAGPEIKSCLDRQGAGRS
jgi:hypothetical protein